MEVLAPMDHRHNSTHTDWFRSGGGVPTPKSSTAPSAFASFMDRPRSWMPETRLTTGDRPVLPAPLPVARPQYPAPSAPASSSSSSSQTQVPAKSENNVSLPPIRALLGDSLASPPSTPTTSRLSLQASPRDNDYDLHSHKRARSKFEWERRPSHTSPVSAVSVATRQSEPTMRRDSAATIEGHRLSKESLSRYRLPNAYLPELRTPANEPRTTSPDYLTSSARPDVSRKRSFDNTDGPGAYDGPRVRSAWAAHASSRPSYGPPSQSVYGSYTHSSAQLPVPAPHPSHHGRPVLPPYPASSSHHPSAGPVPAYGPPALYDEYQLQLAKSRKRNNLPKDSTSYMKRWFDEHLDNPYPSEEDKKLFAQKAGISLTQVSNWFINHRRRCPELREQRNRKQTTGRRSSSEGL